MYLYTYNLNLKIWNGWLQMCICCIYRIMFKISQGFNRYLFLGFIQCVCFFLGSIEMRFSGLAIVNESATFVSSKFHDTIHQGCFSERHQQCSLSALAYFFVKKKHHEKWEHHCTIIIKRTSSTTNHCPVFFRAGHSEVKKAIASSKGGDGVHQRSSLQPGDVWWNGSRNSGEEEKEEAQRRPKKSFPALNNKVHTCILSLSFVLKTEAVFWCCF